jgi:hypothetical protein
MSGIENTITNRTEKARIFITLPVVRGCRLGCNLVDRATTYFLPTLYICLGCSPGCLSRRQISRKTSELFYYFYKVKKNVRYNNF